MPICDKIVFFTNFSIKLDTKVVDDKTLCIPIWCTAHKGIKSREVNKCAKNACYKTGFRRYYGQLKKFLAKHVSTCSFEWPFAKVKATDCRRNNTDSSYIWTMRTLLFLFSFSCPVVGLTYCHMEMASSWVHKTEYNVEFLLQNLWIASSQVSINVQ